MTLRPPDDPLGPWPDPKDGQVFFFLPPGEHGLRLSPNLFLLSWLGMTPGQSDSHVYALRGEEGVVLVDAGTPWGLPRMLENGVHWGLDLVGVRAVFLTHAHYDHARGGYLWQRRGAEILAHPQAAVAAEREWAAELAKEGRGEVCRVNTLLTDGQQIRRGGFDVEAFHTPGHTPGCMSYRVTVDGARWLFSGDVIMSNARPGYRGEFRREALLETLRRLLTLEFDHLGHGHDVLLNDPKRLFQGALAMSERDPSW